MTNNCLHPLANPFTQHQYSSAHSVISHRENASSLEVPQPKPYNPMQNSKNLEVPNQDIPYYDRPVPIYGFIGNSSLFKLADGTLLDLKSCKIIYDPSTKWFAKGYWNDPNAEIKRPSAETEWGANETIESMLARIGTQPDGTYNDPNLSPESIRYWKKAKEESEKLEQNMTDEQKKLLDDLKSGKMFPMSRLVEED